MALSMEEQRLLSEIASRLGEEDPRLAQRLATFGGDARRRMRIIAAVVAAVIVAATGIAAAVAVLVS
jgi:hypothetical protein